MSKTLFFLTLFLTPVIGQANLLSTTPQNCKKNPLFCHILKLQPRVDKPWAMKFSNLLSKYGKKHKLDPWRSLAIAMQESSLHYTKRYHTVVVPEHNCQSRSTKPKYKIVRALSDFGYFQLHASTVKQYKLSPERLLNDLDYMVKTHFLVLKDKIKMCKRLGDDAWSCYHSRTPVLRKRYIQKVGQYYPTNKENKKTI